MKADSMDETNISTWTPIESAPPLAANGTLVSVEPTKPPSGAGFDPGLSAQLSAPFDPSQPWRPVAKVPQGIPNPSDPSNWSPALGPVPNAPQNPNAAHTSDVPENPNAALDPTAKQNPNVAQTSTAPQDPVALQISGAWQSSSGQQSSSAADQTQNPGIAGGGAIATLNATEQVRHGGPFSRNAWRWSLATVAAIVGVVIVVELGLSKLIDRFESGTTQRLAIICASLFSNDLIMLGMLIIAAKAMGMSFRSFGIRRPADVKESVVLAFAAWLIFLLLAGVWSMVSQSDAEREANNPFLRDKTVNTRDASAPVFSDGSDAALGASPSVESTSGETPDNETTKAKPNSKSTSKSKSKSKSQDVADNRHALIKVLNDNPPKALLLSILITGCIGAPLLEELLVRGFLFGAFSQRFGKIAGGAISSLLFGFAHIMAYPLKMIPPLVIMGVALAWLAWQTGSIVPGMFIHAFVNSLGLGVAASLGGHILTLMVGSWIVLAIILFPWIRHNTQSSGPLGVNR
jgi:VIT1/CCC1 family predicted Fe2+/Mn2+ transporter